MFVDSSSNSVTVRPRACLTDINHLSIGGLLRPEKLVDAIMTEVRPDFGERLETGAGYEEYFPRPVGEGTFDGPGGCSIEEKELNCFGVGMEVLSYFLM